MMLAAAAPGVRLPPSISLRNGLCWLRSCIPAGVRPADALCALHLRNQTAADAHGQVRALQVPQCTDHAASCTTAHPASTSCTRCACCLCSHHVHREAAASQQHHLSFPIIHPEDAASGHTASCLCAARPAWRRATSTTSLTTCGSSTTLPGSAGDARAPLGQALRCLLDRPQG